MNGKIILTHSSNWKLLTHSALKEIQPAEAFCYNRIYLAKNHIRANHLQNKFMEFHSEDIGVIPPIYSWGRFLEKIYEQTGNEKYLLGPTEQLFLVHYILLQLDDQVENFSLSGTPFSAPIVRSLLSVINALLMIKPFEIPSSQKTDDPFGKELELILNEYNRHKENIFLDEADLLNLLIDNLDEDYLKRIFPNVRKLFWEIDAPIYPLHLAVVEKMCTCGWDIHFLLHYADHPDSFKNMTSTYSQLREVTNEVKKIDDPIDLTRAMYRLHSDKLELNVDFSLTKYSDRVTESEEIVKRIKKDLVDGDLRAHRIIVTAPATSQYLSLLINALTKHGVPFTATRFPLLADLLPIQHLQLPLELLHENGELSTLKKLLKSPFYNYHDQLAGIRTEAILNSLRVQYDLDIICGQLGKSIEYDEKSFSARRTEFPINHKKSLLDVLQQIEKDIEPLRDSFSADNFFDFFTAQFERHSIVSRVIKWKDNIPHKSIADILGAIRSFINGLDVWRNMINKIASKSQFKALQSLDLFRLVIHNSQFQPFEPQQYGVQILPIQFIENIDVDRLYVLGLTDNNFPRPDTHLFANLPQSISHLFSQNQVYDDRRLFLKLLQVAKKEIHLSYPEREGEALNVASTLMLELERVTGKEILQPDPVPVYSKSDILYNATADRHRKDLFSREELAHFERQFNITVLRNQLEQPFGIYEGDLSKEQVITAYLADLFETKEFSASALEIYAKHPIKYFFRRVLYVDEPEVFEDWVTPIEKGNMVHRVLYRYYSETGEDQRNLENLLRIAEEEIEKFPFLPSMLWNLQRDAFLGSKRGDQKGLFPAFFEYESAQNELSPLRPVFFEVPFGKIAKRITSDLSPGFSEPFEIEGDGGRLQLRGIVDRVDMTSDGGIAIVDYKTGITAPFKDIYQGKSFQLPFYLLAMTTLLKSKHEAAYPLAGCYYKIKDEKAIEKEIVFTDKKGPALDSKNTFPTTQLGNGLTEITLDDFLQTSVSLAIKYSQGIREGIFHHHVDLKDCEVGGQNCPFEPLCRVNRTKLKHLQK
jgi:ATP-dependent helicase/nuclease subunit B